MKRILLIGGAGFIGHHLALSLKQNGFEVFIIDGLEVNSLVSLQDSRVDSPIAISILTQLKSA